MHALLEVNLKMLNPIWVVSKWMYSAGFIIGLSVSAIKKSGLPGHKNM